MPVLRQLPRWAWIGGAVLAFLAGMVNAVGMMGFRHESITNLTGNTTLLGVSLGTTHLANIVHEVLIVGTFVAGAMVSGMIVRQRTLKLGRRYGLALLLESALMFAAVPLLARHWQLGLYLASVAIGLQNGMASTYSGMVFRTTHVTGMLTDLGVYAGHWLLGLKVDRLRVGVCALVFSCFLSGGVAGAVVFGYLQERTLLVPAALTGLAGLTYGIYAHVRRASELPEARGGA